MLATALHYSHQLLKEVVTPGDIVVDATMGNGHDTLLLAELVGETGQVYAFDVQEKAVNTTRERLEKAEMLDRTTLLLQGHETLPEVLPAEAPVKAAIFNLGYLPQSDKSIITQSETTLTALNGLLEHLVPKSRIILVVYYGHDGGIAEKDAVTDFCQQLPQAEYSVLSYQFINQKNHPPLLYCIEKK